MVPLISLTLCQTSYTTFGPSYYSGISVCLLYCRGILPALGHDRVASESEILGALALGPPGHTMHMTHLFNVSSFHHR